MDSALKSTANDRIQPMPTSPRGAFEFTVKENRKLCTDHYRLILSIPRFRPSRPGQFVQLDCRDPHAPAAGEMHDAGPRVFDWPAAKGEGGGAVGRPFPLDADFNSPLAYLRRPFSIADQRTWVDGYVELDVIHRVVGKGTLLLAQLQAGQKVSVLGPMGVGFEIPPDLELACMVGGGVGIPPMMYLAKALVARGIKNAVAFIGAQRHDLLPLTFTPPPEGKESSEEGDPVANVEEFKVGLKSYPCVITTDDGSMGMKGYVTAALRRFLEERQVQSGKLTNTIVYCCGPTAMMKATARVAAEFEVPCQVSLEQPMACGMGTCQSCIIKYRPHEGSDAAEANAMDWKYKLTCTDGPVFDTRDIIW